MTKATRALAVALAAAASLSCSDRGARPDAAYRAFVAASADRDAERAWGLLSSDTQAWLDERARTTAKAAPGVVVQSGRQLLLGDAELSARPPSGVVVLRESRDRAVVQVTEEDGRKREVELVRENGWRVRLPEPGARSAGAAAGGGPDGGP